MDEQSVVPVDVQAGRVAVNRMAVVCSSEESAVTRTALDAALAQLETRLYRALLVQTLTIGGLVVALLKLL